ncbi:MAG: gephyrin-like molybdotransferase Glp [Pseudorhodoplanes sp.]
MAQLSDDCFAFSGKLLPVEEAAGLMAAQVPVIDETETVPLAEANGRVLAVTVLAPMPLPSFNNSAVDGYAVRHSDVAASGETALRVVGRVTAGAPANKPVGRGEAIRIFTGAPMPQGADTVYMQEDCRVEGDSVIVPSGLETGANRRLTGEDIAAGSIALAAGRRLLPADVALAAALGIDRLTVRRRVRVALFSTGDEIVEPGKALPPAGLYDSNRYMLLGMLQRLGVETHDLGILPDDTERLMAAIGDAAAGHDLVLTSGGVSTGEADHVRTAVERLGRLVFWRLAIKPGRPVAMGVIKGAAFVGVPGNPVAVFVTFINVVRPLLFRLAGATDEPLTPLPARATFHHKKKEGRLEYVRVTLRPSAGGDGIAEVDKYPTEGAGLLTSITRTSGLVVLQPQTLRIDPGASVDFLPYGSLID